MREITRERLIAALAESSVLVEDSHGRSMAGRPMQPDQLADQLISTIRSSQAHKTLKGGARPLTVRLFSKLTIDPGTGCLLWSGKGTLDGYGQITVNGRKEMVHRVMYRLFVGEIEPGMEIDHVAELGCVNRHCASPAHLEAVTPQENSRRRWDARRARLRAEAAAGA